MKKKTPQKHPRTAATSKEPERSYGAILWCRDENNTVRYLVVTPKGEETYSLPKGHAEARELPHDAMRREVFEETGIQDYTPDPDIVFTELYSLTRGKKTVEKIVQYAIARVDCAPPSHVPDDEIEEVQWMTADEILAHNTFPSRRKLFADVEAYLASRRTDA